MAGGACSLVDRGGAGERVVCAFEPDGLATNWLPLRCSATAGVVAGASLARTFRSPRCTPPRRVSWAGVCVGTSVTVTAGSGRAAPGVKRAGGVHPTGLRRNCDDFGATDAGVVVVSDCAATGTSMVAAGRAACGSAVPLGGVLGASPGSRFTGSRRGRRRRTDDTVWTVATVLFSVGCAEGASGSSVAGSTAI